MKQIHKRDRTLPRYMKDPRNIILTVLYVILLATLFGYAAMIALGVT